MTPRNTHPIKNPNRLGFILHPFRRTRNAIGQTRNQLWRTRNAIGEIRNRYGVATVGSVLFPLALALSLTACKTHVRTIVEVRDSIRTEIVERVDIISDTVEVEVPREVERVIVRDTLSTLRNRFATSTAQILPDGFLLHTLESIPQTLAVERPQKIIYRDSIVYKYRTQKQTDAEVMEVAKPLTWWQRTQIYGFYATALLLAFKYRRKILALIGKL